MVHNALDELRVVCSIVPLVTVMGCWICMLNVRNPATEHSVPYPGLWFDRRQLDIVENDCFYSGNPGCEP